MAQEKSIKRIRQNENVPVAPIAGIVTVDYPQEGEAIVGDSYTFRVSAPENAEKVEACINKGPWLACRQDSGYWWSDWSGFKPGKYQFRARMQDKDGNESLCLMRRFQVRKPE